MNIGGTVYEDALLLYSKESPLSMRMFHELKGVKNVCVDSRKVRESLVFHDRRGMQLEVVSIPCLVLRIKGAFSYDQLLQGAPLLKVLSEMNLL